VGICQADIDPGLVFGSWKRLVFKASPGGSTVDKNAYTMCVLTQFHRHLKRRDVYAQASARWIWPPHAAATPKPPTTTRRSSPPSTPSSPRNRRPCSPNSRTG
jgi:hypothetical protein